MRDDEVEALRSELDGLSERLADLALSLLGDALHDADPKTSPRARAERIVTRARRSVEKAASLLASLDDEHTSDPGL